MKISITIATLLLVLVAGAQDTTNQAATPALKWSGYVEAYYTYDANRPADNRRPGFLYSHNRYNEFTVNLAFLKASYSEDRVRANLALAAGTYMDANYAAEPGIWKNVLEANAGIKLSRKREIWLDAGIMSSHIGFESAVSRDCWTLTRSMVAENSPYYESGARLGYTSDNQKWNIALLALNGWQRIARVSGNSLMSWGAQVQVKPSDKLTLNYSNFVGSDTPDSTRRWRIYHNLYGIAQLTSQLGLIAGVDVGTQQKGKGSSDYQLWYTPVAIVRYKVSPQWSLAARGEYFRDRHGVIISTGSANGFATTGWSLNADYSPSAQALLRIEARWFNSRDAIFSKNDGYVSNNLSVTASAAIAF